MEWIGLSVAIMRPLDGLGVQDAAFTLAAIAGVAVAAVVLGGLAIIGHEPFLTVDQRRRLATSQTT